MTDLSKTIVLSGNEDGKKNNVKENEVVSAINDNDNVNVKRQTSFYEYCAEELIKCNDADRVLNFFKKVNDGITLDDYVSRKGLSYERLDKIMQTARRMMVENNTINNTLLSLSYVNILRHVPSANRITSKKYDEIIEELKMLEDWQMLALIQLLWEGFNYVDIGTLDDLTTDDIDTNNNTIILGTGKTLDASDRLIGFLFNASKQNYSWQRLKDTIRKYPLHGKSYNSIFKFCKKHGEDKATDPKRKYNNRLNVTLNMASQYIFSSGLFHRINRKLENQIGTNVYDVLDKSVQNLSDERIYKIYSDEYKRSHLKVSKRNTYSYIFK